MKQFIQTREDEFIEILNQVLKKTGNHLDYSFTIHENLDYFNLEKLIDESNKIIEEYYSNCKLFYIKGVQIYDAIVQNQIKYTTLQQIKNLNEELENTIIDKE